VAHDGRLTLGPGLERGPAIRLTVDGRPVTAYAGETLAAVLLAEGLAATRRTRGGSPRGLYCGMGVCYDCLVVLDGVPNTRACMTFAAEGMRVERQDGLGPGDLPGAGGGQ
jgi:aerobic-type carbon monoxide dehydrogenase small subunit (CoxS/CutS family)